MCQEPNYLYLLIGLLTAIVLVTSASPLSLLGIGGGLIVILSLLITAYSLTKRRRQLLLVVLLGISALLPAVWFSTHPEARTTHVALDIYTVNLVVWLLFTFHIGLMIFRSLMTAQRIRSNEIYGAVSLYLLIGVLFTEAYLLLLVWQPGALYFDPGRFPAPQMIGNRLYIRGPGDVLYYSFVTL